jgi:aspartyl-tRNA synthetase
MIKNMRTLVKDTVSKVGEEVGVIGWVNVRRDHGKLIFIDLRDYTGLLQVVFSKDLYEEANKLRNEWIIKVTGKINARPEKLVNPNIETGKVELQATGLEVISEAVTPPISVDTDGMDIGEESRMKYRYLDLRRARMQKNLRKRSETLRFINNYFKDNNFVEVETPILGKSTPEGARDYLVPSRLYPGKFYALPQAPQQYKQLLMVAGLERYFQVARCFRDEDTRGDRQPEFTQIDLEMSFVKRDDVLEFIEGAMIELVKKVYPEKHITKVPFPRISYKEAIEKYKSDKPDLRKDKSDPNELAFTWIVDFPFYEYNEQEKRWDFGHNPFSMPHGEVLPDKGKDLSGITAMQYDLALNGFEIAGGSIRNHKPELLKKAFELLGYKENVIMEKFGHMIEAFSYGVPPHGGAAVGFDRLMMILLNEPNIRETIAFVKTGDGRDLMSGAPSDVDEKQLKELHIKTTK